MKRLILVAAAAAGALIVTRQLRQREADRDVWAQVTDTAAPKSPTRPESQAGSPVTTEAASH